MLGLFELAMDPLVPSPEIGSGEWATGSGSRGTSGVEIGHHNNSVPKSGSRWVYGVGAHRRTVTTGRMSGKGQRGTRIMYNTHPGLGSSIDQLFAEILVLGPILAGAVDNNLLVVIRQLEDDVLVLFGELEVVVGGYALLVDGSSVFVVGHISYVLLDVMLLLLHVSVCTCRCVYWVSWDIAARHSHPPPSPSSQSEVMIVCGETGKKGREFDRSSGDGGGGAGDGRHPPGRGSEEDEEEGITNPD